MTPVPSAVPCTPTPGRSDPWPPVALTAKGPPVTVRPSPAVRPAAGSFRTSSVAWSGFCALRVVRCGPALLSAPNCIGPVAMVILLGTTRSASRRTPAYRYIAASDLDNRHTGPAPRAEGLSPRVVHDRGVVL